MTRAKLGVAFVAVLLVLYLVLTAQHAWLLLADRAWQARVMGAALFALPVLGAWVLVRELLFGARTERLARILEGEGGLPPDDLPRSPGGRIDRAAADAAFTAYREAAEAEPDSWRAWFRLSCAYDAAGDRRRARGAMRQAIALSGRVTTRR